MDDPAFQVLRVLDEPQLLDPEVRVPFLDHRIVEYAFGLPGHLKLRGKRKYILLETFKEPGEAAWTSPFACLFRMFFDRQVWARFR
jgi:asparagine synthetase B (glutamine-hydrolysing)